MTDDPRAIRLLQAPRLVHGHGRYLDDLPDDGAMYAVFVRSTRPHAIIKAVDASAALALAGVLGVYTHSDLESWGVLRLPVGWCVPGQRVTDNPLLADQRVRFVGEPIAAVLAATPYIAEDAASLIEVDYDALPAVAQADRALDEGCT